MKTITTVALVLVALAVALPAAAQATRPYDQEVKQILELSKSTFERFWDKLDGQLKDTTFRGAAGEVVVKKVAEDYKKSIEVAIDRYKAEYSASTEVAAIFREAVRVNDFVQSRGTALKGSSEWQAHAVQLSALAGAYGGIFPPVEGQPVRRFMDKEVVQATVAAEQAAKSLASAFENALKKDKAVAEPARKTMVGDVKALGESAKVLKSRIDGKQPASSEVTALLDQARKTRETIKSSSAGAAMQTGWGRVNEQIAFIARAYSRPWE